MLDTNVVLDWLVFNDPVLNLLREQVEAAGVQLVTHARAIDEFRRVLGYPQFGLTAARQLEVFEAYRDRATVFEPAFEVSVGQSGGSDIATPMGFPRCRDPDDDHFVQLAYAARVNALVSKDKAVLALRRKARKHNVTIVDVRQMLQMLVDHANS